jgi:hypothetical protein
MGAKIQKGDQVFIDPDAVPEIGKYVLLDGELVLFSGQRNSKGVAVHVSRDLSGVVVGKFVAE